MDQLINWNPSKREFARPVFKDRGYEHLTKKEVIATFSLPRPAVIEALVEALGTLWRITGVSATCGVCFKGGLLESRGGWGKMGPYSPLNKNVGGCCGSCASLGENGCMSKPLGCAAYICHTIQDQLHKEHPKVLRWWQKYKLYTLPFGCYTEGRITESKRKWEEHELKIASAHLRRVRRLIDLVKAGRA